MSRALLYCAGGGIGDSLVASVVGRALRQRFDTVDALTLPGHRETLERVPDLDAVLTDAGGDERALAGEIAANGYDACVVTWATPRTARVPHLARIPIRVGQARRLYSYRFTERVAIRSETGDVTSHWSDILLDYARVLGCDDAGGGYRFVPTEADRRDADAAIASLPSPNGSEDFIIVNPCNAVASRRFWPVEGWAHLSHALYRRFALPLVVTGGPADVAIADQLIAAIGGGAPVTSLAGRLGIGAFGALARRARLFAGITTGSMHVAAAVGCPTVGIFPFQSDFPERWAPLGPRTAVVRPSYPCHRGDTKETCADYACIAQLDVARILAAAETLSMNPTTW